MIRLVPAPVPASAPDPTLLQRMSAQTGIRLEEADLQRVQVAVARLDPADADRRHLAAALIPLESYFFRDAGQMALLKERLLPERIRARASVSQSTRSLRIWSAGCSTGEEPYSLAMLAATLLPPGWQASIVASDINREALARAAAGIYDEWSFRGVPDSVRRQHFIKVRDGWEIAPALRAMVQFVEDDLFGTPAPALLCGDFDLVVCRNLLMYYRDEALLSAVDRLARALAPDGFLLVGHNELSSHRHALLARLAFPESAVYCRATATAPMAAKVPTAAVRTAAQRSPAIRSTPAMGSAPAAHPPVPAAPPPKVEDELLSAWLLADRGELTRAAASCEQLVLRMPLAAGPYYLQSHLAQETGDWKRAHALLDRVLYLDPHCVMAYFDLAALCSIEGDAGRAQRLRKTAIALLEKLPLDAPLPPRGEFTAGELLAALQGQRPAGIDYASPGKQQ